MIEALQKKTILHMDEKLSYSDQVMDDKSMI